MPDRTRASNPYREGLSVAADRLMDAGHFDSAVLTRELAGPDGWKKLRYGATQDDTSNLALTMDQRLKDELKATAKRMDVASLSEVVAEGYQAVLDGQWLPPETPRGRSRDGSYVRAVLNVRLDDSLRQQVQEILPALSAEVGYRITESNVAISWLSEELGVERPGENTESVQLVLPKALRAHWQMDAERLGVSLQSVLEDGIRAMRDGSWSMPYPMRAAKNSRAGLELGKLSIRVDRELREYLHEQAPREAAEFGVKVFPGTIAIAILKHRLGQPAE